MRYGAAGAAFLLLFGAAGAQAQWRRHRHREYVGTPGTGLLDPMITSAPDLHANNGPWSGTRDVEPAGETNNLFIGGWGQGDFPPLPPPRPFAPPPAASQPAAAAPQQLPGEGVEPPTDAGLPQVDEDAGALDTPGEPETPANLPHVEPVLPGERQSLPDLPAAPDHQSPAEAVSVAAAAAPRSAAPAVSVEPVLPGKSQSLPDLPAAPAHQSPPEQAKPVELDDTALVHDAIPDLIEILKTGAPLLRERAADELGRRGSDAQAAVPALIEALKSGHDRLKASAALALGDIGGDKKVKKALAKLLKPLLKSKNADVRTSAETALQRLYPSYF